MFICTYNIATTIYWHNTFCILFASTIRNTWLFSLIYDIETHIKLRPYLLNFGQLIKQMSLIIGSYLWINTHFYLWYVYYLSNNQAKVHLYNLKVKNELL